MDTKGSGTAGATESVESEQNKMTNPCLNDPVSDFAFDEEHHKDESGVEQTKEELNNVDSPHTEAPQEQSLEVSVPDAASLDEAPKTIQEPTTEELTTQTPRIESSNDHLESSHTKVTSEVRPTLETHRIIVNQVQHDNTSSPETTCELPGQYFSETSPATTTQHHETMYTLHHHEIPVLSSSWTTLNNQEIHQDYPTVLPADQGTLSHVKFAPIRSVNGTTKTAADLARPTMISTTTTTSDSPSIIYPPIEIIDDCVRNVCRAEHRTPDPSYNPSIAERIAEYNSTLLYLNQHLKNTEHYANLPFLRNEASQVLFLPKGAVLSNIYMRVEGDLTKDTDRSRRFCSMFPKTTRNTTELKTYGNDQKQWMLYNSLFGCCLQPFFSPAPETPSHFVKSIARPIELTQPHVSKHQLSHKLNETPYLQDSRASQFYVLK